jgi:hypothetical protein
LTAASAIEDVAATASSVAGISHRAFLIMVPFRLGIDEPSQPDGSTPRDQSRARWSRYERLPDREGVTSRSRNTSTPRAASRTTATHGPDLLGRWARQARTPPMLSEWGPDPIIASVRER